MLHWGFRCSKEQLTPLGHAGPSWVGEWNLLFNKPLLESTLLPKIRRSGTNPSPQLQQLHEPGDEHNPRAFVSVRPYQMWDSHTGITNSISVCVRWSRCMSTELEQGCVKLQVVDIAESRLLLGFLVLSLVGGPESDFSFSVLCMTYSLFHVRYHYFVTSTTV